MIEWWLYIDGINPQPWKAGELGTIRKGGRVLPTVHKNPQVALYQQLLADEVRDLLPIGFAPITVPSLIHFYFKRQIETYKLPSGRMQSSHVADASNLTKAAEDALQKVLFANDNKHWQATGTIYEQSKTTRPGILVCYQERPVWVPLHVREMFEKADYNWIKKEAK